MADGAVEASSKGRKRGRDPSQQPARACWPLHSGPQWQKKGKKKETKRKKKGSKYLHTILSHDTENEDAVQDLDTRGMNPMQEFGFSSCESWSQTDNNNNNNNCDYNNNDNNYNDNKAWLVRGKTQKGKGK